MQQSHVRWGLQKCSHTRRGTPPLLVPHSLLTRDVPMRFLCPRVRVQVFWFWVSADTKSLSDTSIIGGKKNKRTKKQVNIQLHYVSLYIYFVPLLASAKKEIVCPTRPTSWALEKFCTIILCITIDFLWKQNLFQKSVGHMTWKLLRKKNTIKRAVSHFSSLLIQSAVGLESLGHMTWKILKYICINVFMLTNSMKVPKSVSSDSAWGSERWADRPPAANTGRTSPKSRLDPSEYPPNIQPETNFTLVWWVAFCSLWIEW